MAKVDAYDSELEGYKTDPLATPYAKGESPNMPSSPTMNSGNVDRMARSKAAKTFAEQYVRDCEKDGDVLYKR